MTKPKSSGKTTATPFQQFREAAQRIFGLPKSDVEKVKAKTPSKSPVQRKAK